MLLRVRPFLLKCLSTASALLVISLLTFALVKLSSVNPEENYLRLSKISLSQEAIQEAEHYLGLDKPWWQQYGIWLSRVLRGDFGQSYLLKRPVLPLVLERFGTTSLLAFCAFVLIVLVSTPIGIWSGLHEGSHLDSVVRLLTFSSVSLPSFWVAYLLILLFSVKLNWLPSSRGQEANSLILPSITLSFSLIGQYIALIRKAISEQARSLHVENARLRGVKQSYLIQNHLLRNALPAPVTAMSLSFVYLLTGSIIVEEVFSWNGIGRLFIMSLRAYDLPVIQACMLLFGTLFLLNNLVTQCLVSWIDPHLRQTKEVPCQND